MGLARTEKEWGERASAYLKAKMKESEVTYAELAKRLRKHGLKDETEGGITMKLNRGARVFPKWAIWPVFWLFMGLALGGSFVWGLLYQPVAPTHQVLSSNEQD